MQEFYRKHLNAIINIGLFITTLLIAVIAFKLVIPYLLPFLLGLILAVIMEPLVDLLLRLKLPRWAATAIAMLVTVGSLVTVTTLAIAKIVVELTKFLYNLPHYTKIISAHVSHLTLKLNYYTEGLSPQFVHQLDRNAQKLAEAFSDYLSMLAGEAFKLVSHLPNMMLILVIAIIATFFLSMDLLKLKSRLASAIPQEYHGKIKVMSDDIYHASIGFIKAQLILSAITGLVILAGLIILKTDYVVLLSLLGCLLSPIPVLGVGLLFVPWITLTLLAGNTSLSISLTILFTVVVVIKHSLEPKVLGENIGISPLSVLISLYVGYELVGVYGFILGPFVVITYNTLQKARAFAWLFRKEPKCEENEL
ncbi:AI-2 transport protein TqsA [Pelotomaculum sp. FP]|uniref:sporulation integral membrane protein YtvI n=1 Tax=Pelotomaculum sp. FP TaxID=261474 RepID=UPI001103A7B3|nr:sporulation integral membrane protein YtvI [Pelotomaculum sp. FP]TEB15087.1 AI-2 transport protein TqsA [Pelotomaculum sp. FP]